MNNKLLLVLVLLAIVIIGIFLVYSGQSDGIGEETIKIGVILPLTGNHADQGEASQNAIKLAVEKINSQGGINGKKLEAIFENSECEAQKAVSAINKLVNIDGIKFVIGDICSSATLAIAPIAEENKVLLLNAGSTSSAVRDAGDYVFRFWFSGEVMGKIIAEKANEMGIKKVAIIYLNNDFGGSLEKDFSQRFEELGGTVVSKQGVEITNNDFRTELTNAEEKGPDAYFVALYQDTLPLALKQMKELGINKQVFTHGGIAGSALTLEGGKEVLEGVLAVFAAEFSQEFADEFNARFGKKPGVTADAAYDAVMVLAKVLREKGTDVEQVKQGLYSIKDYEGVSGKISVDSDGETNRPLMLYRIENGTMLAVK